LRPLLFAPTAVPGKGNGGFDLLPLINPPPSSRIAGKSDCARHLGGCLLARAPDLLV